MGVIYYSRTAFIQRKFQLIKAQLSKLVLLQFIYVNASYYYLNEK